MPLDICPACRGLNFTGWLTCEDCQCPRNADQPTQKAHWNNHRGQWLSRLGTPQVTPYVAPQVTPQVKATVPVKPAPWRVLGATPEGKAAPVWTSDPISEAQARDWMDWTCRRVLAGKVNFTKVMLVNPHGQVVSVKPCVAPVVAPV